MVELYQLGGAWGASSISPFCIKTEAYLRMSGIPFVTKFGDPRKGPRKKVPWIADAGTVVSDSQRIIEHLIARYGDKLDSGLSEQARSRAHALRRMLEDGTYFCQVWLRWADEDGWNAYLPVLRPMAPPLIGGLILRVIRRQMLQQLWLQGTGRSTPREIFELAQSDYRTLATELGDKPYLLGDAPSSIDATAFAFLTALLDFPVSSPVTRFVSEQHNLLAYKQRIHARFFAVAADGDKR